MSPLRRLKTWSLRLVIWFAIEIIIGEGNWTFVGSHVMWLSKRLGLSLIEYESK